MVISSFVHGSKNCLNYLYAHYLKVMHIVIYTSQGHVTFLCVYFSNIVQPIVQCCACTHCQLVPHTPCFRQLISFLSSPTQSRPFSGLLHSRTLTLVPKSPQVGALHAPQGPQPHQVPGAAAVKSRTKRGSVSMAQLVAGESRDDRYSYVSSLNLWIGLAE